MAATVTTSFSPSIGGSITITSSTDSAVRWSVSLNSPYDDYTLVEVIDGHTFTFTKSTDPGGCAIASSKSHTISLTVTATRSCTVSYNANGGSGSMDSTTVRQGKTVTVESCAFTYSGHSFIGWAYPYGTVSAGTTITVNEDLTLCALWDAIDYVALTFNPNGGELSPSVYYQVENGKAISTAMSSFPTPTRSYYDFQYWAYEDGTQATLTDILSADTELVAVWKQGTTPADGEILYDETSGLIIVDA